MNEEHLQDDPVEEREEEGVLPPSLPHPYALGGATFATIGAVDLLAHLGPTGLLVGAIAGIVAARHGSDLYDLAKGVLSPLAPLSQPAAKEDVAPQPVGARQRQQQRRGRSVADRLLGRFPEPEDAEQAREKGEDVREEVTFDLHGDDDLPLPPENAGLFLFSSVLTQFHPTLDQIFLARTATGRDLSCTAKDLCHVALAGNTGGGKSSIMRMLMLQLCGVGVRVLLLNPHYTRYDIENNEDWTPFEPYLVHPPMECRRYEVIEHYLKSAAKDLIPKRLERRAHSQPVGKPYFIVLDELPSIVREVKAAPDYIRVILEEGRKVGVLLISAAQDFLVKTISPKAGGGSIRECYRTAYYVGGDPTTAHVLLDMAASLIPEDELGKDVVMLRGVPAKKAMQVFVPYVDNASLYRLLGPSTYKASRRVDDGAEVNMSQPISVISAKGNGGNGGNGRGNEMEMAPQADGDKVIEGVFPVSREPAEMGQVSVKPEVSDEKLEMIKRMKEKRFQDNEIAALVGLAGRKYGIYRHCLLYLGYAQTKEG